MELWDAYNSNFEKIEGLTLIREEENKIPDDVYHLVCHILVRHVDGTYLMMKRDPSKPNYPNMWEASAGGAVLQGETILEGSFRELREETGIVATKLEELDRNVNPKSHSAHVRFLCITDCNKNSVTLQPGETCAFRWMTAEEVLALTPEEFVGWPIRKFIAGNNNE